MKSKKRIKPEVIQAALFWGIIILSVLSIWTLCAKPDKIPAKVGSDIPQKWELILVNDENEIPEDYTFELVTLDNGRMVDARIYPALQEMFDDMRADSIYPIVGEGYRTAKEQEQMMKDRIDAYIYDGYSRRRAKVLAENEVAAVGKSEHQLGLALDINADKSLSTNDEVYAWLAENAYKYGFILRYPADKTKITGIDFEPWHYRYVGKEAAKEIWEQGICLEEYLGG